MSDWSSDVCSSDRTFGEQRHQRLALRAGDAAFVDDQDAFRIAHRFDELLFIDRTEPAQIYHPHLDPVGGEALFGLARKLLAVAIGDDREVGAVAMDAGVTEPDRRAAARRFVDAGPQPVAFRVAAAGPVERYRFRTGE